ncbi:alpha/beta hydrolase [Nocardioides sp. 1609]|uniref:alpha/beta fold hydrolase n=1 Tax=Nocardioides sp. 1609 TaxID=2508327 RepID=UPI00106F6100|nr:alpha/beta hydrolase [Nocardioides sp. 1609]
MTSLEVPAPAPPLAGRAGTTTVDGTTVAWERWDAARASGDRPCVVLVHGTSAHTAWWHHTVEGLGGAFDVVAVDLSGHGESGRRERYSLEAWSAEVAAVVVEECAGPALLVGHSIGGLVAAGVAATRPDVVHGLVLVDSIVDEPVGAARTRPVLRPAARFASEREGLARYRLMPPQPVPDDRTLAYVARHSLRHDDGGWAWKVDPAIFAALDAASLTGALAGIGCPTVLIRGELSTLVPPDAGRTLGRLLGADVVQHDVPDAYHHVMVDQGPAFGRILRRVLDDLTPAPPDPPPDPPLDEESP